MVSENIQKILHSQIPSPAIAYCLTLWQQSPFELKLTRTRHTKIGDFTCRKNTTHPRITLNYDLNPYLFLVTYVHEVAHWYVHQCYKKRVDPHGAEWKAMFRKLMEPILHENIFPLEVLMELKRHMNNPMATSYADSRLTEVFRQYDPPQQQMAVLEKIPPGSLFKLRNRYFKKGEKKRTRYLCREVKTKRQYLVPADVLVTDVQLSLL